MAALTGLGFENYPHVFMPPGAITFMRADSIAVAAGASLVKAATSLVSIPIVMQGYLVDFAVSIADTGNGSWTLYLNNAAQRDYTVIAASVGSTSTPVKIYMPLGPQQNLQLAFSNAGAGAMAASFYLFGWYFPLYAG